MNSTLSELGVAYNNQEIFFTCLVRGSNVLEWNSAEYIGQGGFPLQLLSFNGSNTNVSSRTRPSTYAVRQSVTRENDRLVIVSDLRIIASTQYPVATVACSAQSTRNITFQTLSNGMLNIMLAYSYFQTLANNFPSWPSNNKIWGESTINEWAYVAQQFLEMYF